MSFVILEHSRTVDIARRLSFRRTYVEHRIRDPRDIFEIIWSTFSNPRSLNARSKYNIRRHRTSNFGDVTRVSSRDRPGPTDRRLPAKPRSFSSRVLRLSSDSRSIAPRTIDGRSRDPSIRRSLDLTAMIDARLDVGARRDVWHETIRRQEERYPRAQIIFY